MSIPLVSIIIPVYNAEKYLSACIESVINQTWVNKEIIIVDDGSTDASLNIASSYTSHNIKVISHTNRGASNARNSGLNAASGDYIQFLDADDLLSNDKVEKQVKLLQKNPQNIAVCSTIHFDDGTDHSKQLPSAYEDSFLIDTEPVYFLINLWGGYTQSGSMIQPNAWLCPRHIIDAAGPWNEELTVDDDGEFFTRVLLNAKGVIKSGGCIFYRKYPQKKENLSSQKSFYSLLSQVKSLQLRYKHISQVDSSLNLKKAYARSLNELKFHLYPLFKNIISLIDSELKALNIEDKFLPQFGTKTGTFLSGLIGWKLTKRLQMLIK